MFYGEMLPILGQEDKIQRGTKENNTQAIL